MRKTEYLIIGQGIAGTILSYRLKKAGKSFKVKLFQLGVVEIV
jgi:protoporphyrinogen oxidase